MSILDEAVPVNLDCTTEDELRAFWRRYRRPNLAHASILLADAPAEFCTLDAVPYGVAWDLAHYALTKADAMKARAAGDITTALSREAACDRQYRTLPEFVRR